jgi:hypothetical protein
MNWCILANALPEARASRAIATPSVMVVASGRALAKMHQFIARTKGLAAA